MSNRPGLVYVFDLDGVITDPADSQVDLRVVGVMKQILVEGICLAINTGRSFEWVEQNLLEHLKFDNNDTLDRFIAVCEKGGEMVIWQDGRWSVNSSEFALPQAFYEVAKATFEQNKEQLKSMFWDNTKRTMATIEKLPSADLDTFRTEQGLLVDRLSNKLASYKVKIDGTTVATDVESPLAGKHAGAQLIYEWARSLTNNSDCAFISIGDSVSDYDMARRFAENGAPSTFVYVGEETNDIVHDERVVFISTDTHYAPGALEFLSNQSDYVALK
jgi:hydroxymethylpyrimidine pyrophosphatase-like HAD family hydrolase